MRRLLPLLMLWGCTAEIDIAHPISTTTPSPGAPGSTGPTACTTPAIAEHAPLHRLSNLEYNHTVRDLLFTQSTPADTFPDDLFGSSGFSNDSMANGVDDAHVSDYYDAAVALAAEVVASKGTAGGAYSKLASCAATMTTSTQAACERSTISALATRAYRRPVNDAELTALVGVFDAAGSFDTGLSDTLTAVLMNPKFLFVSVVSAQSQDPAAAFAVSDFELAARLSYFLWQSMPDDQLVAAATAGTLHTPEVLAAQVQRMLQDPKIDDALHTLRDEYAGLSILSTTSINGLDDTLRLSMLQETDLFLRDMVTNDRNFTTLFTGQTAFVNGALAQLYGMTLPAGADASTFMAVQTPQGQRAGILTEAGILAATAGDVHVTHPVKRGHWVTDRVMCSSPPPPPPNVPLLSDTPPAGQTVRDLLQAHVSNPVCNACHQVMDPVGLSLENYDSLGKWRTTYDTGLAIDPSGTLPNGGPSFTNAIDLYNQLAHTDDVKSCFAEHLMDFALERAATTATDTCLANHIGVAAGAEGGRFSDLVLAIASSPQFQQQTGEAP